MLILISQMYSLAVPLLARLTAPRFCVSQSIYTLNLRSQNKPDTLSAAGGSRLRLRCANLETDTPICYLKCLQR